MKLNNETNILNIENNMGVSIIIMYLSNNKKSTINRTISLQQTNVSINLLSMPSKNFIIQFGKSMFDCFFFKLKLSS